MEIIVCGPGCAKCDEVERIVRAVIEKNNTEASVIKEKDFTVFAQYGVFSTPSVVINGKVVCVGKIPTENEILGWFD
jgi:small redox-active disulfide protein 2